VGERGNGDWTITGWFGPQTLPSFSKQFRIFNPIMRVLGAIVETLNQETTKKKKARF
jgi:hypothetical protein